MDEGEVMGAYTDSLEKKLRHKGSKTGYCVICGEHGNLTRDHVPPKKCNNVSDHELSYLLSRNGGNKQKLLSQGGTHFKTICQRCNGERLGGEYDPALVDFSNEVTLFIKAAKEGIGAIPREQDICIKPQRVARSVIGHLLAANSVEEAEQELKFAPMYDVMREYFLDPSKPFPDQFNLYFWPYPCRQQVIVKCESRKSIRSSEKITGNIIKFLPFGFWLLWKEPKNLRNNLENLIIDKNIRLDDLSQVKMDYSRIPEFDFPERPESDEVIVRCSKYAVVGTPRN